MPCGTSMTSYPPPPPPHPHTARCNVPPPGVFDHAWSLYSGTTLSGHTRLPNQHLYVHTHLGVSKSRYRVQQHPSRDNNLASLGAIMPEPFTNWKLQSLLHKWTSDQPHVCSSHRNMSLKLFAVFVKFD